MTDRTNGSIPRRGEARQALLNAAVSVIRRQGLHATTVDDFSETAGVTKGAFFHHFATKEDLAVAAPDHWSETTGALFARAPYHDADDPADRVLGYLDFRASLIAGDPAQYTCLVGTMDRWWSWRSRWPASSVRSWPRSCMRTGSSCSPP